MLPKVLLDPPQSRQINGQKPIKGLLFYILLGVQLGLLLFRVLRAVGIELARPAPKYPCIQLIWSLIGVKIENISWWYSL